MTARSSNRYVGFTYIEITIVLAIFAVTAMFMIPLTIQQTRRTTIDVEIQTLASWMFATQHRSYTHRNGTAHGIWFGEDQYIIYEGEAYSTSSTDFVVNLPTGITISTVDFSDLGPEVNYPQGDFRPAQTGFLEMTDGSVVYRLNINPEGLIYHERVN